MWIYIPISTMFFLALVLIVSGIIFGALALRDMPTDQPQETTTIRIEVRS